MKNKRGSHVSFIISFVLFVSFLIFFIGIIKPFEKAETGKEALLKHLENEISKEVSADVLVVSALENSGDDCSEINGLNIKNYISKKEGDLLKIYSFGEFPDNTFQCNQQDKYEIGLIRNQSYILESKVFNLNESYNSDYLDIKEKFGIPEANDFEFSFLDIDEKVIIETAPKETSPSEVLAELIPVIYLSPRDDSGEPNENNAEIKNGYIKVVLW